MSVITAQQAAKLSWNSTPRRENKPTEIISWKLRLDHIVRCDTRKTHVFLNFPILFSSSFETNFFLGGGMRPSILYHRTQEMQRENQLINELIKIIVIRLRGSFRQQARSWNGKSLSRRNQLNEMKFHSPSILLSSSVFHSLRFLFSFSPPSVSVRRPSPASVYLSSILRWFTPRSLLPRSFFLLVEAASDMRI